MKEIMSTSVVMDMDTYLSSMEERKEVCNNTSATSVFGMVSAASTMFVNSVVSKATEAPKIGNQDVDTFMKNLESGKVVPSVTPKLEKVSNTVLGMAGETYSIVKRFGLILIIIFCIVAIIKLAASNGSSKNEGKSGLVTGLICICVLGALGSFVTLAFEVGADLF